MKSAGKDITIKINNTILCYDDEGTGDNPVIFIHGFPFDKSSWKPQLDYLSQFTRVITIDTRGYGNSVAGDDDFSMQLFADDVIGLMDILRIDKAFICGLSMGGYIVLNAISRYQERFYGIILCDTQCLADSSEGKEKRYKAIKFIDDGGLIEWINTFIKNIFSDKSHTEKKDIVEGLRSVTLSVSKESVIRTLKALAERDETCFYLPKITVPALIICGENDIVVPPALSESLHKQIKNSEFHVLPDAGHMSNLEQPEKFNELLKKFIVKK